MYVQPHHCESFLQYIRDWHFFRCWDCFKHCSGIMLCLFITNSYGIIFLRWLSLNGTHCGLLCHIASVFSECFPSQSVYMNMQILEHCFGVLCITKALSSSRDWNLIYWTRKRNRNVKCQARQEAHKGVVHFNFTIRLLSCIIDRLITTCASGEKIRCIKVIHTFSKRHMVTAIYVCMPNNKGTIFFSNSLHKIYFLSFNTLFHNTGCYFPRMKS